jgi:hypothetical protein
MDCVDRHRTSFVEVFNKQIKGFNESSWLVQFFLGFVRFETV